MRQPNRRQRNADRSRQHRVSNRGLSQGLEALESRQLLAYSIMEYQHEFTPEQWAAQITSAISAPEWNPETNLAAGLENFESEEEAFAAIRNYALEEWEDIFGSELNEESYLSLPLIRIVQSRSEMGMVTDLLDREVQFESRGFALGSGFTNNFVGGVDELDHVEITVDNFLFLGKDSQIEILDISNKEDIRQVGSIPTNSYRPNFFISGDNLIIRGWNHIQVLDISDRSAPVESASWTFDGYIQDLRTVDGKLLVFTSDHVELPPPQLILAEGIDPDARISLDDTVVGRFETAEEYFNRVSDQLVASFLPRAAEGVQELEFHLDVGRGQAQEESQIDFEAVGDWQDISVIGGELSDRSSGILLIDLAADSPAIVDSESLNGVEYEMAYVDSDSIYFADSTDTWWGWNETGDESTNITKLAFDATDVTAVASGHIDGEIVDVRTMDEYQDDLRVVTQTADLFVLRQNDEQLEVIGELLDMADGQRAFGAYFDGDRAIVTTSEIDDMIVLPEDPLHGIDLSDPSNPVELSELEIPGVNNSLRAVGDQHFIGVGYFMDESTGDWSTQVSLYDVSDLANPTVVENWVSSDAEFEVFWIGRRLDELAITFDQATGVLLLGSNSMFTRSSEKGALAFRVDLTQEDSKQLEFLGRVNPEEYVSRAYVVDDAILTVSHESIAFFDLENPEELLGEHNCEPASASDDSVEVVRNETTTLDVLENDDLPAGSRIVSVSESSIGNSIRIAEDGQSLWYTASEAGARDRFRYVVETASGERLRASVRVTIPTTEFAANNDAFVVTERSPTFLNVLENDEVGFGARIVEVSDSDIGSVVEISPDLQSIVYSPSTQNATDSISYTVETSNGQRVSATVDLTIMVAPVSDIEVDFLVNATDTDGNPVTTAEVGDLVWIELSADRLGFFDNGVFQAVFDVNFDTDALQIVGEPEFLNGYDNVRRAERSETGFSRIGAVNGLRTPGSGPNVVVRFQVEVTTPGDFKITSNPLEGIQNETLVYDSNFPVDNSNITPGEFTLSVVEQIVAPEPDTDVNGDGFTSPVDALMLIDHLNTRNVQQTAATAEGERVNSRMDVNKDGSITPIDALMVIGKLNEVNVATRPEGEAGVTELLVYGPQEGSSLAGLDTEHGDSAGSSNEQLDALAAAFASDWDLERRKA